MTSVSQPKARSGRRLWRDFWKTALLFALLFTLASIPIFLVVSSWWGEAKTIADHHLQHRVAHPGWSFPGRVFSDAVPITGRPAWRLIVEAKTRGYTERCPDPGPGQFCEKTGKVVPRSGDALEPLLLGWLVGPDGEIREHLSIHDAPKHLVDAIVASEDRDFRSHYGVNLAAMIRSTFANAREGSYVQGGSTLTMQMVRGFVGQRQKTIFRKLREIVLALALDSYVGKDGILQMYLDYPYLGQRGGLSICGFEAAAQHYFSKPAKDLDISQAATLVGILPSPARLSPDKHPEKAKEKRDRVLRAMATVFNYDVSAALEIPITTFPPQTSLPERFPSYLSATRAWLETRLPQEILYGAGLQIVTAIDVPLQIETERVMDEKTRALEKLIGKNSQRLQSAGALMDIDSGRLKAIWGGFNVTATSFNRATQAKRQPGSAFKPLVYALAFGSPPNADGKPRFTAASIEPNSPRVFKTPQGNWSPRNVGGEYTPRASLAYGLALSQNIATASLLQELGGPRPLIEFAKQLGIDTTHFPEEMGLALGQGEVTVLEMAQFAASIANGGKRIEGMPVLYAFDAGGVEQLRPVAAPKQVLAPEVAALTRDLMRQVVDAGTGGAVRGAGGENGYRGQVMGKTGTTDREKDVWFIGATPRMSAAVWLGRDKPEPLGAAAADLAAPLWGWWMSNITKNETSLPTFPDSPKLSHRAICTITGKLAGSSCKAINAPFLPGTEPKAACQEEHVREETDDEGAPTHKKYEGLWKRLAREKAEREAKIQ